MISASLHGQASREPMMHGSGFPVPTATEPTRYNLKLGRMIARFRASLSAEASDNISLADGPREADLSFGPDVEVGFLWPLTQLNVLQLDMGLGYRYFIDHPDLSTLSIAPHSRLDWRAYFDSGQINFYDSFSVQMDPTERPDLSGNTSGGDVANFRRFQNTAGLTAEWRPVRPFSLVSGYAFTLDRSLSGEFTSIDRDDHTFTAGGYYDFTPRFSAGLSGSCTLTYYREEVQNDGVSYTLGPRFLLKPTQFMTIDGGFGYAVSSFDDTGSLADDSDFRGLTGQLSLRHTLNSRSTQELRLSKGRDLGLGSNFYDILSVQYGLNTRLHRAVSAHGTLVYEHYRASGGAEESADRYLASVGAGFQLSRLWQFSATYSFSLKDSNLPDADYHQNRLNLQLTRQF